MASAAIYREGHFAHRQARALADLAGTLELYCVIVDRLSTDERLPLGALSRSLASRPRESGRHHQKRPCLRPGPSGRACG